MKPIEGLRSRIAPSAPRWPRKKFLKDRRGATAIEFAMISVPFLGLIGAIFESGLIYFRSAQLQTATETSSRVILTNNAKTGLTYDQFVTTHLCPKLSSMFDCKKLIVDVSSPENWDTASTGRVLTAAPRSAAINIPAPGRIAIVRIMYPQKVIMGFMAGSPMSATGIQQVRAGQEIYEGAWTYMLMGIAAFRVEP